jgi:hypothetical protein
MDWLVAKDSILSFLTAGGIYFVAKELHNVRTSIDTLNKMFATLMERTSAHKDILDRHEEEIRDLRDSI